jgi:sulfatase modifying factor 1
MNCTKRSGQTIAALTIAAQLIVASCAVAAVNINWTTVGNPGNAADPLTTFGAVGYSYQIDQYEVTNSQYADFLNAKAASDPFGLYSTSMASDPIGGITRSGASGGFTYAVKNGFATKPVVYVDWYDAARFVNWLSNGQGNGSTETGAYTLLGGTPVPSNGDTVTRNAGPTIFLPSRDEWYKAAYYDPSITGYWKYATRNNSDPIAEFPPGGTNSANYSGSPGPSPSTVTDVGAYLNSHSAYNTFDQSGNVGEWGETLFSGSSRWDQGGGWDGQNGNIASTLQAGTLASFERNDLGFRVASAVPEPQTLVLAAIALAALATCTRSRFGAAAR